MRFVQTWLGLAASVAAVSPVFATGTGVESSVPPALGGSESVVYRNFDKGAGGLRIYIFKPSGWIAKDRRPAFMWFFGGGWASGTPANSAWWAKWAAAHGMVGIAPDYRVRDRFGTSPLEAVADARWALRWVEEHAKELGVDPRRIVVGGNSAGGHLALWTAIRHAPPGANETESPRIAPAALILTSAVSDTSKASGYTPERFGQNAQALSPVHQLDRRMPPMLIFHGDADLTVPQSQSLRLRDRLEATGNVCEFVSVPAGSHNFGGELPGWADRTQTAAGKFLQQVGVLR